MLWVNNPQAKGLGVVKAGYSFKETFPCDAERRLVCVIDAVAGRAVGPLSFAPVHEVSYTGYSDEAVNK